MISMVYVSAPPPGIYITVEACECDRSMAWDRGGMIAVSYTNIYGWEVRSFWGMERRGIGTWQIGNDYADEYDNNNFKNAYDNRP